jgi:hypothetical protein
MYQIIYWTLSRQTPDISLKDSACWNWPVMAGPALSIVPFEKVDQTFFHSHRAFSEIIS